VCRLRKDRPWGWDQSAGCARSQVEPGPWTEPSPPGAPPASDNQTRPSLRQIRLATTAHDRSRVPPIPSLPVLSSRGADRCRAVESRCTATAPKLHRKQSRLGRTALMSLQPRGSGHGSTYSDTDSKHPTRTLSWRCRSPRGPDWCSMGMRGWCPGPRAGNRDDRHSVHLKPAGHGPVVR
jgi:hypothetical protein